MSTAAVSARVGPLGFWARFCEQLEIRIREGNVISGETLWRTSTSTGPAMGLCVQNIRRPDDRVDCMFDPKDCLLTFTPGAEIPADARQFRWIGGTTDVLCRGSEEFTLSQALTLLLDELVWPDE
jgi:hypothetical protein